MLTPEQVSAEARRALADRVSDVVSELPDDIGDILVAGAFTRENWLLIADALRAQPDRGAEEMRERCARLVEATQEWSSLTTNKRGLTERTPDNLVGLSYAAAIRALPLASAEGGGDAC